MRFKRAGYQLGVLNQPLIWHKQSVSFKRTGKSIQRYYDTRNLARLLMQHSLQYGRRTHLSALSTYCRYVFQRYSTERDAGETKSAEAVVLGLYDVLIGAVGQQSLRSRPGISILRLGFKLVHSLRSRVYTFLRKSS